jgi:hypothetical protein
MPFFLHIHNFYYTFRNNVNLSVYNQIHELKEVISTYNFTLDLGSRYMMNYLRTFYLIP